METLSILCLFFSIQIVLFLFIYFIVIGILIKYRSDCFRGSYYAVTISLGIADVLSGSNLLIMLIPSISIETAIWIGTNVPILWIVQNNFANVMNVIFISHLLSISFNRVAAVGFPTTKAANFVSSNIYAVLSICFCWGCGLAKLLMYVISKCNGDSSNLYLPVTCVNSNIEEAKFIHTLFICIEMPIVLSCIILHFLLAMKVIISTKKVKLLPRGTKKGVAETAAQKLMFLSLGMTLTLMIPYSTYALAFAGAPNLDTFAMSMVALQGIILHGVGNSILHVLFNSLIREKIWTTMRCKNRILPVVTLLSNRAVESRI